MQSTINQVSQTILDSAESVKTQVIVKGTEVQKIAEEIAAPYVDQALEMKKSAEETLDNSFIQPVRQRTHSSLETLNNTIIEPANQLRERVSPTIKLASDAAMAAPEAAKQFMEARMGETTIDRHTADVIELAKALAWAIYAWSLVKAAKFYQNVLAAITASTMYNQILDQLKQSQSGVDTAIYAENSMGFYFQWAVLVAFSLWELSLTYVPTEYSQKIESTISDARDMVTPYHDKASEMLDDLKVRAEEPLKMVQEYGQPIKSAIIERGATVEALVKQSVLGDIFDKGMSTINSVGKPKNSATDIVDAKDISVAPVGIAEEVPVAPITEAIN